MKNYNGLVTELDSKYFPEVKYYHDNKNTQKIHYYCELFNNGFSTLSKTVKKIAKITKEKEEKIEKIILNHYTI